ncbi:hypothetical protein ACK8HH_09740 [Gordonia sp. LUNF6]|uniref:Uncharacterized protein n=2 Tax=Gordonia TaxID=2053 RepID=M3UGJ6_GORML|nr:MULTISPECIES: hypothetical protein [Gordonia]GAC78405.1 hypothetical protein GM1_003_01440 [Gordonia malaquae NBRC 108250]GEE03002.1 hypothetical protein nbrc107696_34480 [Gordonia spumicola]
MVTVTAVVPMLPAGVPVPTVVPVLTVVVQVPAMPAGGAMLTMMVGVVVVTSAVLAVPAVRGVSDSIVALRHCRVMAVDAVYGGAADISVVVVRVGVSHPAAFLIVIPQLGW